MIFDTGFPYMLRTEIEFDLDEDAENVCKRGIPLALGAIVLANAIGEVQDMRHDYRETRMKASGKVAGCWFTCVYTMRGSITHIVTVHRVREREVRRWLATK